MSGNWTPGRWSVWCDGRGYPASIKSDCRRDTVPGAVGNEPLRWLAFRLPSSAEALANARLIAAAPDLYEALEAVPVDADYVNAEDLRDAVNAWWARQADPALAKARGDA